MAINSTVFRANLQIADMDRHYYESHTLTLARHPSETDERLMMRILAFALHADEHLEFGQGMTDNDEADLWLKDLTGNIELWIDVGLPEEKLLRKAAGRAKQVVVYVYGGRSAELWFADNLPLFKRYSNLTVRAIPVADSQALAELAQRTMTLQFTLQDGEVWINDGQSSLQVETQLWHPVE